MRLFEGKRQFKDLQHAYFLESLLLEPNLINILLLCLSAGVAQTISVFSPNTTSLLIRWGHLKPYFLPDAVGGYELTIINLNNKAKKINVSILASEMEVTGLEIYSEYCMTMRALTREGYGSKSDEVCALTAEDGKNCVKINFFSKCIYP